MSTLNENTSRGARAPVTAYEARRRRGRRQLLVLAAIFFVPLAVAFWLYYGPGNWRPVGGTNQGDLIDPAIPLAEVELTHPDGTRTRSDELFRGKWTMAYLGPGHCDERCRRALYLSRQSRIALNKDMDRVRRVFLATGDCCDRDFLQAEHPDLVVVALGNDDASRTLLEQFPSVDDAAARDAGRLWVIDPLGNLVLSYSERSPDKALLTDLRKLLRLSHIG
jgi:cytochrome oxidase Cu insertion factor (SCO1/SenC/PrrC family)